MSKHSSVYIQFTIEIMIWSLDDLSSNEMKN